MGLSTGRHPALHPSIPNHQAQPINNASSQLQARPKQRTAALDPKLKRPLANPWANPNTCTLAQPSAHRFPANITCPTTYQSYSIALPLVLCCPSAPPLPGYPSVFLGLQDFRFPTAVHGYLYTSLVLFNQSKSKPCRCRRPLLALGFPTFALLPVTTAGTVAQSRMVSATGCRAMASARHAGSATQAQEAGARAAAGEEAEGASSVKMPNAPDCEVRGAASSCSGCGVWKEEEGVGGNRGAAMSKRKQSACGERG